MFIKLQRKKKMSVMYSLLSSLYGPLDNFYVPKLYGVGAKNDITL